MREWAAFILAALFWGSSYLWIKIALEEIGPFTLVAIRLFFAVLGLAVVVIVTRVRIPRSRKTLTKLFILSVLSPSIPFMLISWGETRIASSVAAVLNGSVPLLTIWIAHLYLPDEKLTFPKVLGLLGGFSGVLVLFSGGLTTEGLRSGNTLGQLAVVAACVLYSMSTVYSRSKLRNISPVVAASMTMFFADAVAWLAVPFEAGPFIFPHRTLTWIALIWLGLLGSCAAFLFYFHLLNKWGAVRTSFVNYLVPLVGLLLGVVVRGEHLDWHLMLGALLILAGIAVVNYKTLVSKGFRRVHSP